MNAPPRAYTVSPDSETARLLREAAAAQAPIRVDTGEAVYRVAATETEAPSDPAQTIRAIYASTGILTRAGVDAARLERDIYADRAQWRRGVGDRGYVLGRPNPRTGGSRRAAASL